MTRERLICKLSGLQIFQNKTLDQMTDQDCIDALKFICDKAGISYYLRPLRPGEPAPGSTA